MTTLTKLRRMRRTSEGRTRWYHPNGYVITQDERDWTIRGFDAAIGMTVREAPKRWYEVTVALRHPTRIVGTRITLREARSFCDELGEPTNL